MATAKPSETPGPSETATGAASPVEAAPARTYDSRKRVTAYDATTGEKLPYKVPETHLDGRFPNLKEAPSSKAGK